MKNFNLNIEYNKNDKKLYITEENSSGCKYQVIDKDTFLSAIEQYYDTYIAQDKAKDTIDEWLGGFISQDDLDILYNNVLNAKDKDFDTFIDIVNEFLGYQNNDGEFDGLAMELSEIYEEQGE